MGKNIKKVSAPGEDEATPSEQRTGIPKLTAAQISRFLRTGTGIPNNGSILTLEVISGPCLGRIITITKGKARVGRRKTCGVCLLDETVSESHADIFWEDGRWYVQDLGSSNGTVVRDAPAFQGVKTEIIDRSLIMFGHTSTVEAKFEVTAQVKYLVEARRLCSQLKAKQDATILELKQAWDREKCDIVNKYSDQLQ